MTRYSESELRLQDPAVKKAIRTLQARGVTLGDIEKAYQYYDKLNTRRAQTGVKK